MSYTSRFRTRWLKIRFRSRNFEGGCAAQKSWLAPFRLIAACRLLSSPLKLKRLWSLDFMRPYFSDEKKRDTFFFLTHNYYLSRDLTLAQRIDCAVVIIALKGRTMEPSITALSISRRTDSRSGIES